MEFPETWAWDAHDMLIFDDEAEAQIAERTQRVRSPEGAKLHAAIDSLEELIYLEATQ
jgi:hypothetical protein